MTSCNTRRRSRSRRSRALKRECTLAPLTQRIACCCCTRPPRCARRHRLNYRPRCRLQNHRRLQCLHRTRLRNHRQRLRRSRLHQTCCLRLRPCRRQSLEREARETASTHSYSADLECRSRRNRGYGSCLESRNGQRRSCRLRRGWALRDRTSPSGSCSVKALLCSATCSNRRNSWRCRSTCVACSKRWHRAWSNHRHSSIQRPLQRAGAGRSPFRTTHSVSTARTQGL